MATDSEQAPKPKMKDPLGRLFPNLPHGWRVALDWILTIAGAVAIVLAIKAWVMNPYRIPSSSMEPTLHCARPAPGCEAHFSDRVLANRFIYHFRNPKRGEIVVFNTPIVNGVNVARQDCGAGGTFVKRIVGLPGDTIHEDSQAFIWVNGKRLTEPYVQAFRRAQDVEFRNHTWHVPPGSYFMMGDNRGQSCDSRKWGPVPKHDLIGKVVFIYWPPNRIGIP
jgi:signal peptidase I